MRISALESQMVGKLKGDFATAETWKTVLELR
jgi:hypothetical protein